MNDFKQMIIGVLISINGGALAGWLLASYSELVTSIPGIFIFIPGFLAMRGSISGSLSSRLSTALHLGTVKPFDKSPTTYSNIIASMILSLIISLALGIFSFVINLFLGINNPKIVWIGFSAGMLASLLMIPITVLSTFYFYRKNIDPDNVMGPYITSVGDIVSMLSLVVAVVFL